jgi:hypothetical protein
MIYPQRRLVNCIYNNKIKSTPHATGNCAIPAKAFSLPVDSHHKSVSKQRFVKQIRQCRVYFRKVICLHRACKAPPTLKSVFNPPKGGFFLVRPAWARSWRCKSSRKLTTANEVKRNCVRVTDRGEEAWNEAVSRWTRTGYEAVPSRASRPKTAKLLWSKARVA